MLRLRLPALLCRAEACLSPREVPEWLRTYRAYCVLTAAFVPLFGLAYDFSATESINPVWARFTLSGVFLGLLLASYCSTWVARRLNHLVYGAFLLLSFWIVALAVQNEFSADYSASLIFCVAATSLALSFIPSARLPLLWYQIVMTAVGTGAALLTPEVHTGRVVLVGCLAGIAFVTDVAATIRTRLEDDRERYKNHLIEANERAEEMLHLKAAFINNMNHEIRTPLTGIIGFAEVIGETAGTEQQAYARVIQDAGRRLMDTLTGILDLAHLEAGSFDVTLDRVDLNAAAREVAALLDGQARPRGLSLHVVSADPGPVIARADHTAVTRILYNLVSNAIKFTDEGGVEISAYVRGDTACISIEDTGIGIDETFLPHIFDEFKQESSGVNRSYEGTGLGLTVTQRLVELMDGAITIRTRHGAGSTFTVTLPRADAAGRRPRDPAAVVASGVS